MTGRRLSNMEFAQKRVAVERLHQLRSIVDQPFDEITEQDMVELNALINNYDRSAHDPF